MVKFFLTKSERDEEIRQDLMLIQPRQETYYKSGNVSKSLIAEYFEESRGSMNTVGLSEEGAQIYNKENQVDLRGGSQLF